MSPAASATAFPAPEDDYPVRAAGHLSRRDLAWLLALTLLALIPRAVVAARLGPVCDDGYFYLAVADAYERGDYAATLHYLNINIYPVLLAGLHRLGLDPIAAAKLWGVAAGGLVVPPLFGWLRRMLDRRVAFAACGVYALHTEFVELSPEPIRDATFWLLTATSLYFCWRAATERALWLFAAAGLSVALAAHTRTEGWLLALPAVAWPVSRWRDAAGRRLKVAFGFVLLAAMTPLFVAAFNVTALAGHSRWEWGRLEHLRVAARWLAGEDVAAASPAIEKIAAAVSALPSPAADASPTPVPTVAPAPTLARAPASLPAVAVTPKPPQLGATPPPRREPRPKVQTYLRSLGHALEPVPLLLMLLGAVYRPRMLVRPEHLVLSACCAAVLIAVGFRLATLGDINGRYFLLCFFPAAGAVGIGLLAALHELERRWPAYLKRPRPAVAVAALLVVLAAAHAGDAVRVKHPSRAAEGRLGEALAARFGRDRSILVVPQACRVGYYAAGHLPAVMLDATPLDAVLARTRPEIVILEREDTPRAEFEITRFCLEVYGLRQYDLAGLPEADRFAVLTAPGVTPKAPPARPVLARSGATPL